MANRYHTDNPQRKIHAPEKGAGYPSKGSKGAVKEATASWGQLPGKAGATGWGKDVTKVKTYVKYTGC